jgi:hypothetical protein
MATRKTAVKRRRQEWPKDSTAIEGLANNLPSDSATTIIQPIHAPAASTTSTILVGFLSLPPELRTKVYRYAFVSRQLVKFPQSEQESEDWSIRYAFRQLVRLDEQEQNWPKWCFPLSAQLLRTCTTCLVEGRAILYGENAFQAFQPGMVSSFIRKRVGNTWNFDLIKHVVIGVENDDWPRRFCPLGRWSVYDLSTLANLETVRIWGCHAVDHKIQTAADCMAESIIKKIRVVMAPWPFSNGASIIALTRMSPRVKIYLLVLVTDCDKEDLVSFVLILKVNNFLVL